MRKQDVSSYVRTMGQVFPRGHKFCGFEDRKNVASIRRSLTIRLSQEIAQDYSRPSHLILCGLVDTKRSGVTHSKFRTDHTLTLTHRSRRQHWRRDFEKEKWSENIAFFRRNKKRFFLSSTPLTIKIRLAIIWSLEHLRHFLWFAKWVEIKSILYLT